MSTYSTTLLCLLVLTSTVYAQTETSVASTSLETGSKTSINTTEASSTSTVGPTSTNEVTNTSSPTTTTPTQTSLQTNSSNGSETASTGSFSSAPSSSNSVTDNETISTTSLPTVNNTSEHQTGNSTTEQSSGETTTTTQSSGNGSTASSNPTTSVAPTTSTSAVTTSTPTSEGKNPYALVILLMKENSTFSCRVTCNYSSIRRDVYTSFSEIDGFYSVREKTTARRRRDTSAGSFTVEVLFVRETIITMSNEAIRDKTMEGFVNLNKTVDVHFAEASYEASKFANDSRDLCLADNPCKDEYKCIGNSCSKLCTSDTCSNHGTCSVVFSGSTFMSQCKCDSNNDYEYSGDKCENEDISKAKVIQIVSGVLGAFCALFLLIIIIMCCRRGSSKSSHLYQIGSPGYANDGYSNESELKRM